MRQVEFLDAEIAAVEALIAAEALSWPEVKRLMTVPGVNVIVAATFMSAVGDIAPLPRPAQADRLPRSRSARPSIGCRARESRPHLEAGLGVGSPCTGRGELVDRPPAGPDRRLLRPDQGTPRPLDRDRRVGAQARLPVLVPADARRGLRLRAAVADEEEAAPTRAPGRRAEVPGRPRRLVDQRRDAQGRARARATGPGRPTNAPSRTGSRRRGRARQRGAHQVGPRRTKSRGRRQAPNACASTRRHPRPQKLSHTRSESTTRTT